MKPKFIDQMSSLNILQIFMGILQTTYGEKDWLMRMQWDRVDPEHDANGME